MDTRRRIPWPDPPPETTWVDLLQRRAATLPDREIYHLLDDEFFDTGVVTGPSSTFAQLDRLARATAVVLEESVRSGDRVLLLFDTGLEFMPAFFGCHYAGVIPVPAYPPYRGLQVDPLATLRGIAENCEPSAVITGGPIAESVRELSQADPRLAAARWLTTESIDDTRADEWQRPKIDDESPDEQECAQRLVGCGRPWLGHEVVIADPETLLECEAGRIGEIWVSGPCVARGYWNRPEESEQTFSARLAGSDRGPFLRTGDLGFVCDGELYISGRLKDVIIICGPNYYSDDIEATVRGMHEAFRPGTTAALGVELDGEERLIVLQEIDRQGRSIDIRRLVTDIRQRIAEEHQLQLFHIVFLRNGSLPKTTSGKIKRFACREMCESDQLPVWKGKASE